ncbi:MAG: hypothetical protein HOV81_40065, partial [Kofleriaceae bacterium]|nr:hypothetical protein [Kofleriaceae bacterium]
ITAGAAAGATLTHDRERDHVLGSVRVLPDDGEGVYAVAGGISAEPSTGISECDLYRDSIYELASCEGIPQNARNAILDAYTQAASAWEKVPAEARVELAKACKVATDAIRDSIKSACPAPQMADP